MGFQIARRADRDGGNRYCPALPTAVCTGTVGLSSGPLREGLGKTQQRLQGTLVSRTADIQPGEETWRKPQGARHFGARDGGP